jgi:hypothetical protein
MKKSQVSFEFMVLFALILFVFVFIAYFFPSSVERAASTKGIAENLAKDIKVNLITASLSESDYASAVIIPKKINDVTIRVEINAAPDNILIIKDNRTGETLARAFLPRIDSLNEPGGTGNIRNITIKKDLDTNTLSIDVRRE